MLEKVEALKKEIESFSVSNSDELEKFRLEFLSKNGKIQSMFKMIGKVAKEEKAAYGKSMNDLKNLAQNRFQQFSNEFSSLATTTKSATDDITLTEPSSPIGSLHPLTQTMEEMKSIFYRLGFTISHGPEIEDDFHNFTALNFPPNHPARDEQDTFFVRKSDDPKIDDLVLRTHTSPVQIRLMENQKPPI
ncbi:MAG TPA: phenylalanine--tRNA ligase subunit alpha, partial [Balneola sp.]|nr:phenylalanine--tRNA ligase subunit alpha [Balneola sp.]